MKTFNLLATFIILASAIREPVSMTVEEVTALKAKSNCPKNSTLKGRSSTECSDEGFKHPSLIRDISQAFVAVPSASAKMQRDEYICRALLRTDKYGKIFVPGKAWRENDQWKCVYPYGGVENRVGEGQYHEILTGGNARGKYEEVGFYGHIPPNALPVGVRVEPYQPKDVIDYSGTMATGPAWENVRYNFIGRIPADQTTHIFYTYDDGYEYTGSVGNANSPRLIKVLTC